MGGVLDQTVKTNAVRTSDAVARVTFSAMYQVMSNGWKRARPKPSCGRRRAQAAHRDLPQPDRRRPLRRDQQAAPDAEVVAALADGRRAISTKRRPPYLPADRRRRCLHCHKNAEVGAVLGAIEINQTFGPVIDKARATSSSAWPSCCRWWR